ncbi:MAG: virulence factor SrfB [Bacteroidaceae bacterium]|nr:virulence factor SrfB [Bacteroidaceae bacterium]
MNLTLIANSGIQLYTAPLFIDKNTKSRQLFHEWFDEEEIQTNLEFAYQLKESLKVVRLSDLAECRFVDTAGNLLVDERDVLANPNIEILYEGDIEDADDIFALRLNDAKRCRIDLLLNEWLPLPFLELDALGRPKSGPYNWVRCKIVPRAEQPRTDGILADILLAVDTHAVYDEPDDYVECPAFVSDSETEKTFRLSVEPRGMMDFCSGRNTWVRNCVMQLIHGVEEFDDIKVKDGEHKYNFLATYMLLVEYVADSNVLPDIRLMRDRDVQQTSVEMIIDIGNSRTSAILFEDGDFTRVKALHLQDFSRPLTPTGELNISQETFDMRVAFQKVSFGDHALVGSQQFTWPSFVRLGLEAEYLTHQTTSLAEGDEIFSTYSSPKRYLWDYKSRREEWRCVKLTPDGKNEVPIIEGISNYFNDDGSINEDGWGIGLHYSRKTLMTLAFMEILAQARMQINSPSFRTDHGRKATPRRLDRVVLTCPTAMSGKEQQSLHESLRQALYVLNRYYNNIDETAIPMDVKVVPDLSRRGEKPQWIFDEATCSQFVYLYGKFSETYQNNSQEFFRLYGRPRTNADGKTVDSLVIGSLDIGAGTSDVMICRYEYNAQNTARLSPIPVFYDSFDYAGDDMMKVLIENVLLQGKHGIFERELERRGVDDTQVRRMLYQFFSEGCTTFQERVLRRDFNLQVCVPVIYRFLDLLSHDETYRELTYDDIFSHNEPSAAVLTRFQNFFGFELRDIRWTFDAEVMNKNIEHTMDDLLKTVANIMYAHDCDLVLLSGRPASLKPIHDSFLKYFAVSPNRLVVLNKHRVGRWMPQPFADEFGYLLNSKSIVPFGAMIGYLASNAGGMSGFSLDLTHLGELLKPTTDYFVLKDARVKQNKCFLTPDTNTGELTVNSFPTYIGSKQVDLPFYPARPFYVLDLNESAILGKVVNRHADRPLSDSEKQYLCQQHLDKVLEHSPLTFTIERDDYDDNRESLTITSVRGADDVEIPAADFALTVQSLNDPDCYWLDSGSFNINIKSK